LKITHRTYLWLSPIVDVIMKSLSVARRRLKNIISTLPTTGDQAYEAILKSVDEVQTRKLLCIVPAAKRPLTLK
jgi:hypothetical protein